MGLGAHGAATVCSLSENKEPSYRVLGVDRFSPPHVFGSTHGDTRITRLAIGEGEQYSPLAIRSHQRWREIEQKTSTPLLTTTGGLIISGPSRTSSMHGSKFFENTVSAANRYHVQHRILSAAEMRKGFPPFNVQDDEVGYYELEAGFLRPEECVKTQLELALSNGVEIHRNEEVFGFEPTSRGVTVNTRAATYSAEKLIITAGSWVTKFIPEEYRKFFRVRRQVMYWFDIGGSMIPFIIGQFPVFIWETRNTERGIYGFPAIDGRLGGVKIASEQHKEETDPASVDRTVTRADIDRMYDTCVAPNFAGLSRTCIKTATCLYTVTPDFGFVIDYHPESQNVIVASPCSGHGFKHSPAVGELLAQLATKGETKFDIGKFSFRRFS